MNILNLAGELLLLYLLYKFIFNFIIPVYQATTRVKREFNGMQQKMQEHMNKTQAASQPPPKRPNTAPQEEYIDYEEIKWGEWFFEGSDSFNVSRLTFNVS